MLNSSITPTYSNNASAYFNQLLRKKDQIATEEIKEDIKNKLQSIDDPDEKKSLLNDIKVNMPKRVTKGSIGEAMYEQACKESASVCISESEYTNDSFFDEASGKEKTPTYVKKGDGKIYKVSKGSGTKANLYIENSSTDTETFISEDDKFTLEKDGIKSVVIYNYKDGKVNNNNLKEINISDSYESLSECDNTKPKRKPKKNSCDTSYIAILFVIFLLILIFIGFMLYYFFYSSTPVEYVAPKQVVTVQPCAETYVTEDKFYSTSSTPTNIGYAW